MRACACVVVASVESSVRGVDSTTLLVASIESSVCGVGSTTLRARVCVVELNVRGVECAFDRRESGWLCEYMRVI